MLPAVTCSVQTTYLTGKWPNEHGIVGNGWFDKNYQEIKFWHQSNKLINTPCIWDELKAKDPKFKCANMFWWFNMYSTVDYSVTPRPQYRADGLKYLIVIQVHPIYAQNYKASSAGFII